MAPNVTNAVLQERIEQYHSQVMQKLVEIVQQLQTMNGQVRDLDVVRERHDLEIKNLKDDLAGLYVADGELKKELVELRTRYIKIAVAVAVLSGAVTASAGKVISIIGGP